MAVVVDKEKPNRVQKQPTGRSAKIVKFVVFNKLHLTELILFDFMHKNGRWIDRIGSLFVTSNFWSPCVLLLILR